MNKEKLLYENSKHALQSDNIIAITNRHLCSRPFMEQLERVCKLHPHAIVLREKDMPEAEYLSLARDVIALCKEYDVQCMLHSFINVAMELEHPYIHLPLPILEAYVKVSLQYQGSHRYMADHRHIHQPHQIQFRLSTFFQCYRYICPLCRGCHKSRTAWRYIYDGRTYFCNRLQKRPASART